MSSLSGSITSQPECLYFWAPRPSRCFGCRAFWVFFFLSFFFCGPPPRLCFSCVCAHFAKVPFIWSDRLNGAAAAVHPHRSFRKGTFSTLFRHDGLHLLSLCSFLQLDSSISILGYWFSPAFTLPWEIGREPAKLRETEKKVVEIAEW